MTMIQQRIMIIS